jgi:NADPH2:quinone reductase
MRAVRVHQYGGPEALRCEEVPLPEPKAGEARVKIKASGVNFIDIYHRTGLYPNPLPFILGVEGAGIVDAVGPGVTEVKEGDPVAYAMQLGSHAEFATVPAWKLAPIPEGLDFQSAAAAMLQGITAHYLTHDAYRLKKGEVALVHAAAGGVGLLLVQMAKSLGAAVVGTVSTDEKARIAKEAGADEVIRYDQTNFASEVKQLTGGHGVHVVYDSVGKSTFEKSLECLAPRGFLVLFGQSSGPVPSFNPAVLSQKGSLFLTRPSLIDYMRDRAELLQRAGNVFRWVLGGELKLRVERTFPLAEVEKAQRELEGRRTTGKLVLIP